MPIGLTNEFVVDRLSKEGYRSLEAYTKSSLPFEVECPNGHAIKIRWTSWQQGTRCKVCAHERNKEGKKVDFLLIKEAFEKESYRIVDSAYINTHTPLSCICSQNHSCRLRWSDWQQGVRCRKCSYSESGLKRRKKIEKIREAIQKEGYSLLSQEYLVNTQRLELSCPRGHLFALSWDGWQQGYRCRQCSYEKRTQTRKETFGEIVEEFKEENYELLTREYLGYDIPMECVCSNKHRYSISLKNWRQGVRCPKCSPQTSKAEKELFSVFSALSCEKTRSVIPPYELDVYFPDHKLAIEYCGLFWHSSYHARMTPQYHYQKMSKCNEKGIRLITVFEDEWLNKKELCLSRISAALGISQNKIAARKCVLKEVSREIARDFLEKNHLQGSSGREIAFGLYYQNVLVSVMTLGKPSRAHISKTTRTLELKRFASLPNLIVVGGASKLFKVALVYARQQEYERVVSYCDMRWGTGRVYEKLKMKLLTTSKYTPHYTDFLRRWRNQSFAGNSKQNEKERVEAAKVYTIYDCGHQTWEFTL